VPSASKEAESCGGAGVDCAARRIARVITAKPNIPIFIGTFVSERGREEKALYRVYEVCVRLR
jgi:hypothetical protein